ncbi:MAG: DUF1592 domain-containing protein [Pirellulales bacterium]
MRRTPSTSIVPIALLAFLGSPAAAEEPNIAALADAYRVEIRPIFERFCYECHSGESPEAEIDLAAFVNWSDIRKAPKTWQKVNEMLGSGLMPPDDAAQPNDAERTQLKQWLHDYLKLEAQARAGDPGRVVLRRLNNAEYTYTLRDLTRVDSLDPAREFPVDGAAGEGFTNTGNALAMSPALVTKYLDAAKEVARHAVLLPDGFRFSQHTSPRDWTDERLATIREFYRQFTDSAGGDEVNVQGIVIATNQGGRLPLAKYITATLAQRDELASGRKSIQAIADQYGLNAKYLGTLWSCLTSSDSSAVLDAIRERWRAAGVQDAAAITADIAAWQKGLWTFATVGHIGKVGGPTRWLEPVNPLTTEQEFRLKIPATPRGDEVVLSLVANDAGDGNAQDVVVWQQPRLVAPGRPDLLLRDVRDATRDLQQRRERMLASTAEYLSAADEAATAHGKVNVDELALKHGIDAACYRAWLDYLGIGSGTTVEVAGHFTDKLTDVSGYSFIRGWGSHETPLVLANSSDQHVRVPGNMKPHSVAVHPSPTLRAAVGWRSPVTSKIRIDAAVTHAHPECGNGVAWSLELRRGSTRRRLAAGTAQGSSAATVGPLENISVQPGDLVSLLIGPRDGNHACDLTAIEIQLTCEDDATQTWSLADEVSSDVTAGNPHADRLGNEAVWHFYAEPAQMGERLDAVVPDGSLLATWQMSSDAAELNQLAHKIQTLLTEGPPADKDGPDALLYNQVTSLGGPLLSAMRSDSVEAESDRIPDTKRDPSNNSDSEHHDFGLDPALFGKRPDGNAIDAADLCVQAPSIIEVRLPADLVEGCELVTTGVLEKETGTEGSVQLQVIAGKASDDAGLLPNAATTTHASGQWTNDNRRLSNSAPVLVTAGSAAWRRIESEFDEFRELFPAALCYVQIVPVDEAVTLTLFHREDDHLMRLMLDDPQRQRLNRLWDELHYISQDALTLVDAYEQLMEYATQDADPKVFESLRKPIYDRAAAFRQLFADSQAKHMDALLEFAAMAYRRPLTSAEADDLRAFYGSLRLQDISHEEAFRLTLARVLVAPAFLYRVEKPAPGEKQRAVSDWELASRLSYFLWSSQPDEELRRVAAAGQLHESDVLVQQTRRMFHDAKIRRLAIEFACQWLQIYGFDDSDEKSETHFPMFAGLRGAMYEESIQFFTDFFQNDGSVLDIIGADHTFLNEDLANLYGIPNVSGPQWHRVDGMKQFSRGGILAQASTLAKQSGASRTSPILRGNWISEVLLGERLPLPPKGVPPLPDDEADTEGLTVRQLVEKHTSDPNCSVCHERIDPYGFSLEAFDAIGRKRERDLGDRPIITQVKTMDGTEFQGLDGLQNYLLTARRDAFVRQFCRKLLGYALGRAVQLSDEPLLAEIQKKLESSEYKIGLAVESIVCSPQFREIRGIDAADDD